MDPDELAGLRENYARGGLVEEDLAPDPYVMFGRWLADAVAAELHEPNAMVLSTADSTGAPSSRMVLLKGCTDEGFVFYTNLESRKGQELAANPACALLFPWHGLERQVRVEGTAVLVPRDEVTAYFASRPRGSQVGAWASPQSRPVQGRDELDRRYADTLSRFDEFDDVPVPDHWGGYVVRPEVVEFWQGRPGRMHDRLVYRRAGDGWSTQRLAP